jgi:hypothetical protein
MAENLYENELVKKLLSRAQEYLREEATASLDSLAEFAFDPALALQFEDEIPYGSPLEAGFEIWWAAHQMAENLTWNFHQIQLELDPQHPVTCGDETYRLDFRIVPDKNDPHVGLLAQGRLDVPLPRIGVELDGHEFHEKTKEQVTYRNQRDRALQQAGWTILHFSGSEFVRRPLRCVEEAARQAGALYFDFARALERARERT